MRALALLALLFMLPAAAAEAMTSLLIFINKNYKVDGAGIRITGELNAPD